MRKQAVVALVAFGFFGTVLHGVKVGAVKTSHAVVHVVTLGKK